jgi:hypothetical protein
MTSPPPPLTIVGPGSNFPRPPRQLGSPGLELWTSIQREYFISDPGGIELLCQACTGLDRAEQLAEAIAVEGAVVHTRSGSRPHPAIPSELAARSFVCRTIEKLGLNLEPIKPVGHHRSSKRDADD